MNDRKKEKKGEENLNLFEKQKEFDWKDEWQDMPEFIQEKQEPFAKIIIRFACEEDLNEFAEMIGQKLTPKTKSIWHPKLIRGVNSNKRYSNES